MFLDASAIVAVCGDEKDAGYFIAKIEMSNKPIFYSSLSI
ncbi:MAG: VapC toxin family PIN domain ribonuclease, partial [Proteobacteria bacterium]